MLTQEQIDQTFLDLRKATSEYWIAKLKLMNAQREYERLLSTGLLNGAITGKNETERLGSMYHEYPGAAENWLDFKEGEAIAKMNLELAKLEVEQIQTSLTYLQVMRAI